jgi:hypothetical protein
VIRLVHGDRLAVVVDRDVGTSAGRPLDAERGSAAAGEGIDDQLVGVDAQGGALIRMASSTPGAWFPTAPRSRRASRANSSMRGSSGYIRSI